jgi:hypothetical protein
VVALLAVEMLSDLEPPCRREVEVAVLVASLYWRKNYNITCG